MATIRCEETRTLGRPPRLPLSSEPVNNPRGHGLGTIQIEGVMSHALHL